MMRGDNTRQVKVCHVYPSMHWTPTGDRSKPAMVLAFLLRGGNSSILNLRQKESNWSI